MNGISPVDTGYEADRIYRAIFRSPLPDSVGSRFRRVADQLNQCLEQPDLNAYYKAIHEAGDLEALEIAGRWTGALTLLSTRFLIMVHLAETHPGNQHFFINSRPRAIRGWWTLVAGSFATAFKLVKGLVLLKRYRHA